MGSALTVLLGFTRDLNIILLVSLLVHMILNIPYRYVLITVFGLMCLRYIWLSASISADIFDIFNYYATPLPDYLELILPYILLLVTYYYVKDTKSIMLAIGVIYSIFLVMALFPSSSFDRMAASNFWSRLGIETNSQ